MSSGSDRIYEALEAVDPEHSVDIVVNVQGDLPTIKPPTSAPRSSRSPSEESTSQLWRPSSPILPIVAIQTSSRFLARRSGPTACRRKISVAQIRPAIGPHYHHIGLYTYRRPALERFVKLPPSTNEQREKLEQLRALDAGMRIDVIIVNSVPLGVDTPEDLETARKLLGG